MKKQTRPHEITVTLLDGVQLERRDLMFLRRMAQHCVKTQMSGAAACERLDEILRRAGILTFADADGPVYDVFE